MPTERFYRLPKEKVDSIRMAAVEEFKRVPPEEASINKIIQSADISRGSFYTYFNDKYDLLRWVMGDFISDYQQFYITELAANGGNLWDVFERVLPHMIQWVSAQGLVEIVGNMMKGNFLGEHMHQPPDHVCRLEEENISHMEQIHQLVLPACCALDFTDFQELMGMHVASLVIALKNMFEDQQNMETIQAAYRRRMKLLRYGACPRCEREDF